MAEPNYPFHKLMSGPTGPDSIYELYVTGKVTAKALGHIAASIMQTQLWLAECEAQAASEQLPLPSTPHNTSGEEVGL